jgi:diguanylate cyclase (GGDEF)-like protein
LVLSLLGSLVLASVRSTDVVARYGGDEFGLLFVEAGVKEANAITMRLLERITRHNQHITHSVDTGAERLPHIPVTVSVGVTPLQAEDTMETLIRRADTALYEVKNTGRNQVKVSM